MRPLYIITARGGSKGIPRKNIKLLGGKPLIYYTISAAQQAAGSLGGYILLSTNDNEIAAVSRACGLTVDYMRPEALGGDSVGSREVILDALQWAESHGIDYDTVVLLQPTSPLRTSTDITEACRLYEAQLQPADMVVSVCASPANPYWDIFETGSNGCLHICKGDGKYTRRQDVPPVWQYNGAVYVIRPESLKLKAMKNFGRIVPYEMPSGRSIDLDTPDDWARAEQIFEKKGQ